MVDTKIMLLHKKSKLVELEIKERKIAAKLSLVKANKSSTKKEIKLLKNRVGKHQK